MAGGRIESVCVTPNALGLLELDNEGRRAKLAWEAAVQSASVGQRTKEQLWNIPGDAAAAGDASPQACAALHANRLAAAHAAGTPVRPSNAASVIGSLPPLPAGQALSPTWTADVLRPHFEGKPPTYSVKPPAYADETKSKRVLPWSTPLPEGCTLRSRQVRLQFNSEQRRLSGRIYDCLLDLKRGLVRFVNAERDAGACWLPPRC